MPDEAPSLRETLESAIEEHTPESAPEPVEQAPEVPAEAAPEAAKPAADGRARDDSGKFKRTPEKPAPGAKAAAAPKEPAGPARTEGAETSPPAPSAQPAVRPPQSWKPTEREAWAKVPAEAQQAILRREREVAVALQQAAEKGKSSEPWNEAVRPYEAQIRAAGQEPHQYVGDLLKTAHALTYGAPQQKAGLLAELIMNFGVPPAELDQALVARMQGRPMPQQVQPAQPPQEFRDPRFDKFLEQVQQRQAAETDDRLDTFAQTHEFFDDVADDMQVIMAGMAQAGRKDVSEQDLEWAYNAACLRNADVSAALSARKATEAARAQAPTVQRAKLAASSIRASPVAATQNQGPRSLRETIEDAIASGR